MNNNIVNQTPYLRTTWDFPEDQPNLSETLGRSYLEVSQMVNDRTIGIFPANKTAIGGEAWFLTPKRQQNLRQIYPFTAIGNIRHGLPWSSVSQMTKCTGAFTDGTNWYGALFASNVPIAGQISFYITDTNIVILSGIGAPGIIKGTIVLEWISQV